MRSFFYISLMKAYLNKLQQLPRYQTLSPIYAPKLPSYHSYLVTRPYLPYMLPSYQVTTVTSLPDPISNICSQVTSLPQLPSHQTLSPIFAAFAFAFAFAAFCKLPSYHSYLSYQVTFGPYPPLLQVTTESVYRKFVCISTFSK